MSPSLPNRLCVTAANASGTCAFINARARSARPHLQATAVHYCTMCNIACAPDQHVKHSIERKREDGAIELGPCGSTVGSALALSGVQQTVPRHARAAVTCSSTAHIAASHLHRRSCEAAQQVASELDHFLVPLQISFSPRGSALDGDTVTA